MQRIRRITVLLLFAGFAALLPLYNSRTFLQVKDWSIYFFPNQHALDDRQTIGTSIVLIAFEILSLMIEVFCFVTMKSDNRKKAIGPPRTYYYNPSQNNTYDQDAVQGYLRAAVRGIQPPRLY
ncbi:hypothetical protein L596_001927 [Steinernema carpocapsae]|uniref:Uncharacterized protein n=1 Tax=Steinernema carpocapsae TaxID=34508 RepID=A0A4U8UN60_STECR|nr:hypothetical protein L596_001927 [Steinernema carpocapsae]